MARRRTEYRILRGGGEKLRYSYNLIVTRKLGWAALLRGISLIIFCVAGPSLSTLFADSDDTELKNATLAGPG